MTPRATPDPPSPVLSLWFLVATVASFAAMGAAVTSWALRRLFRQKE